MFNLIKEVGRGKKGAKNLSYEQARTGAEQIISGRATPAQIGAFLVAERIKMESADEILSFVDALRERIIRHPIPNSLDCAGPYDGRRKSFLATLPVAFVLAADGLPVTLHGCRTLPPKFGSTALDLFHSLKLYPDRCSPEALQTAADQTRFLFVPAERWCPPLADLRHLREEIGIRTLFNTAEKLLRYSDAPLQTVGVFHQTAVEKMQVLLTRIGVRRGLIVQGVDGSEDLPVNRRARITVVQGDNSQSMVLDPADYGFNDGELPVLEWTIEKQATHLLEVLEGQKSSTHRNMVIWNSGIRLWFAERVGTIEEGMERATQLLDDGLALERFQRWSKQIEAAASQSVDTSSPPPERA
ncbi:anthranilate phosphoribosyltransferase [Desmospora activa]|nr:anthranilate phosphoribosyltransferase [Desmospora activa]